MLLQDRPDAQVGDDEAHGGELAVDATLAPSRVLLRQANDERGDSLRDAGPIGTAMRVCPVPGDEAPVPAEHGCQLDERAAKTVAGQQSCESRQHRPARRVQRRSIDMAPHDDLDGDVGVTAEHESNQLEDAAERSGEEREGHCRKLDA